MEQVEEPVEAPEAEQPAQAEEEVPEEATPQDQEKIVNDVVADEPQQQE